MIHFDLRTKIFVLIIVNILLFSTGTLIFECILTGSCILLIAMNGQGKSALHFAVFFLLMAAAELLFLPRMSGFSGSLLLFIAVSVRKVLPCLIIGKWILTSTEVSEFVAVMWKLRLPQDVIIPISVVFRYFPTLQEEWQSLRMAMKMRGIGLSVEHVMVPLMMSAVSISDELSAAALCRGLDAPEEHTCLRQIRMAMPDLLAMILYLLLAAGIVIWKVGGWQ